MHPHEIPSSYNSYDWSIMERAHERASQILKRPKKHEDADRLSRRVMGLFDHGIRDVEVIAKIAAAQEADVTSIAHHRFARDDQ